MNCRQIVQMVSELGISREETFSEDLVYEYIGKICEKYSFSYNTGISRLVIKPTGQNFVIKLPFNYWFDEEYCEYYELSCYKGINKWDACEYEQLIYNQALIAGFEEFFLTINYIAGYDYPIYIQPLAEIAIDNQENYCGKKSNKTKEMLKNKYINLMSEPVEVWFNWVYDKINDDNRFNDFLNFLNKYDIAEDLHEGNIGIYHNKPVIVDYAGFNREQEQWK